MMRLQHYLASAALAVGMTTTVLAADVETPGPSQPEDRKLARQCLDDLQAFDREMADVGFGILPPGSYGVTAPTGYYGFLGTPRDRIQALRAAAQVFAMDGDAENCHRILGEMHETFEEHQELTGFEADDPAARTVWRRAHLANAKAITDMGRLMRADVVLGADVRNLDDEKLGEIEDIVLDPTDQRISYVLVSRGGFLFMGGELVAVRWQDLRATTDHEMFVLDVSKSSFEEAPAVGPGNLAQTTDPSWREEMDRFWDKQLAG